MIRYSIRIMNQKNHYRLREKAIGLLKDELGGYNDCIILRLVH